LVSLAIILFSGEVAQFCGNLFGEAHLLDLSGLGAWGVVVGVLVYEFFHYWYHRAAHQWSWLWRASHQLHHSAESLDAFGANYLHRYNYSDLPLWDALFGTFRNPRKLESTACGFYKGASSRLVDLLIGRDVSIPDPQGRNRQPLSARQVA
jgi:sterol desaturase/sphingolipid hydroxylase (fatty acid hydroxylase superfamily)